MSHHNVEDTGMVIWAYTHRILDRTCIGCISVCTYLPGTLRYGSWSQVATAALLLVWLDLESKRADFRKERVQAILYEVAG